uniref:Uncharacterized protein n=1 Tax=Sphaerodactylus townsendi TaxID=933632 RepID=A0ACB8EY79_9SAUR
MLQTDTWLSDITDTSHFAIILKAHDHRLAEDMFIIVLHGENKADIFNSHCKVQILLDCIKSHCGCKEEGGENSSKVDFTPLLQDDSVVNQKFLAKLGSWQDPKAPSPRVKPRKTHHKKASLDIPAMDGLRNHSPLDSRTRTPNASPRQSRKL